MAKRKRNDSTDLNSGTIARRWLLINDQTNGPGKRVKGCQGDGGSGEVAVSSEKASGARLDQKQRKK